MPVTPGPLLAPAAAQLPLLGLRGGQELETSIVHLADVARDDLADLCAVGGWAMAEPIGPIAEDSPRRFGRDVSACEGLRSVDSW